MKRYFVWKDANCNGINPEWLEISGAEFAKLKKEYPARRFIPSYDEDDPESDVFLYEATKENYNEWNRDQMRYHYRLARFNKLYKVVSFDELVDEEDPEGLTWAEIIPDTSEEDAAAHEAWQNWHNKAMEALKEALSELDEDEMKLVNQIFLQNPEKKSERAIAKENDIPQKTFNCRKKAVLKKMKKIIEKKFAQNEKLL